MGDPDIVVSTEEAREAIARRLGFMLEGTYADATTLADVLIDELVRLSGARDSAIPTVAMPTSASPQSTLRKS